MSTRAGSHAGRGFRYQDAVAVYFCAQEISGHAHHGSVFPEGGDDLELRSLAARTLVQVKSRRDHLGPFSPRTVASFIRKMWDAQDLGADDRFLLVLESDVGKNRSPEDNLLDLSSYHAVVAELKRRSAPDAMIARTKVLVLPNPRSGAIDLIAATQGCTLLEAEIFFSDLIGLVGRVSDDNGLRSGGEFLGISISDVQYRFVALQPMLTSLVVEEALTLGYCDAVDFLSQDADPLFYLGVDVQASHVAAGLVVERPELRATVLSGLESKRNALIYGASGSGKSALLWEAAHASRHSVRWFLIRSLSPSAVPSLVQLARSRRASPEAPVGFIIDDVGRGFSDGWGALATEVDRNPGLLLLASVREEDRYPLTEARRALQIEVVGDETLAERVWRELRERGQTAWKGWKEPWNLAAGHLLEYIHALTQGQRLSETLHAQVAQRMNDPARHGELDILRLVSCANAAGCGASISEIPKRLGVSPSTVSHALTRLKNEHLAQNTRDGLVVGLHEVRSQELLRLCHEYPPPLLADTAAMAALLIPANDLKRFLERTLSRYAECDNSVLESLSLRLEEAPSPVLFSAILTGLDLANAHRTVRTWLDTPEAKAVPKSLQPAPAGFAIANVEPPDVGPMVPACRRFTEIRAGVATSGLTARFLARLAPAQLRPILAGAVQTSELTDCLSALLGQAIPPALLSEFGQLSPPLLTADFEDVVSLLDVAARIDRSLAIEWVNRVGQPSLHQRFSEHVSWADTPYLQTCEEGWMVQSNIWYVASSVQPDIHDSVVRACDVLVALTPIADVVASTALGADGSPMMLPGTDQFLVKKRIPREVFFAPPEATRNREWLAILNAQLAVDSYTAYLANCLELVQTLNHSIRALLDARFREKKNPSAAAALGRIHMESSTLVAPEERFAPTPKKFSKLQGILSSCSVDLIVRFFKLPEDAPAYLGWLSDLIKSISSAETDEPWHILSSAPPKELRELRSLIEGMQTLSGEAHVKRRAPFITHRKFALPRGKSLEAAIRASTAHREAQLKALENEVRAKLSPGTEGIGIHLLPDNTIPSVWPPADILITPKHDSGETGITQESISEALHDFTANGRKLCLLPVLRGLGLTNLASSGYSALLPVPSEDAQLWCRQAGVGISPLPTVGAFTRITHCLEELQGIDAYFERKSQRTRQEESTHRTVLETLEEARHQWQALEVPDELRADGEALINASISGDLWLAAGALEVLRGNESSAMATLNRLLIDLTIFDSLNAELPSESGIDIH